MTVIVFLCCFAVLTNTFDIFDVGLYENITVLSLMEKMFVLFPCDTCVYFCLTHHVQSSCVEISLYTCKISRLLKLDKTADRLREMDGKTAHNIIIGQCRWVKFIGHVR